MILTVVFYVATLGLHGMGRLIRGRWAWGIFAGGLAFGLYNEICFEFCWDYSAALGPTLWRDIPVVVILGWGATLSFATAWTDLVIRRAPRLAPLRIVLDVGFFALIGVGNELIMHGLGYWTYNFPMQGNAWTQVLGYVAIGLLTSSVGRRLDELGAQEGELSELEVVHRWSDVVPVRNRRPHPRHDL